MNDLEKTLKPLKVNPGEKVIVLGTVGDWVDLATQGIIFPDKDNRDGGNINESVAESVAKNFDSMGIGAVHMSQRANNTYELCDANSRTEGLVRRINCGLMTENDLDTLVPFIVVHSDDHFDTYLRVNDQKGHSNKSKIANPNGELGKFLKSLCEDSGLPLEKKHWLNFADIILAFMSLEGEAKNAYMIRDIFRVRKETVKLLNNNDAMAVSNKEKFKIKAGLSYIKDVLNYCYKYRYMNSKHFERILKSPGLFMFLMADFLSEQNVSCQKPDQAAAFIMANTTQVLEYGSKVARRNNKLLTDNDVADFTRILTCSYRGAKTKKKEILLDARKIAKDNPSPGDVTVLLRKAERSIKKADFSLKSISYEI